MPATDPNADDTDQNRVGTRSISRRTLLKTTAVVGATVSLGGVAMAQSSNGAIGSTTIKFDGEVSGWHGRAPSSIEDETNPTLTLEAGTEYTVTWTNTDGQPHNFQMLDSDGNVLHKSEIMSEQGASQTTSFTATSKMAQYNCAVHPSSMVGEVEVEEQSGSNSNGTNGSSGNESSQSNVSQSPNRSTNESGGSNRWNITANGSAEPGVVDNASANTSTNGAMTTGNATTGTNTGTAVNATTGATTAGTTGSTTMGGTTAGASTTGAGSGPTEDNGNTTGPGGDTSNSSGNTTTGGSGPGFGALTALGGLAVGAARLLAGRNN